MATIPSLGAQFHRGYTKPPADTHRANELRVKAEREAVHLLDEFLRDRAETKRTGKG